MTVNIDLQNHAVHEQDGHPRCMIHKSNPNVGYGGGHCYQMNLEQNNQTAYVGMTDDGQYNMFVDDTITISGGNTKEGGCCINIIGKNGDVTITAENNGDILIKGSNITVEADNNLVVSSKKNLTLKGCNSIFLDTPNLNTNAKMGNLVRRSVTFGGRTFAGTKVGQDKIESAFTSGALDNIQNIAKKKAEEAAKQLETLSGKIDTDALSAQASQLGEQLSSIDTSGLSNALNNFGGFG